MRELGFFIDANGIKSTDMKVKRRRRHYVEMPVEPKKVLSPYVFYVAEHFAKNAG